MINVKGNWALITGASRGVGYQTAIFMAKQGCNLGTTRVNFQYNSVNMQSFPAATKTEKPSLRGLFGCDADI